MTKNTAWNDLWRARWMRWLGQVTRVDKPYWVKLLEANWISWADKVLQDDMPRIGLNQDRISLRIIYGAAIARATVEQLDKLDNLYCEEKMERMDKRRK